MKRLVLFFILGITTQTLLYGQNPCSDPEWEEAACECGNVTCYTDLRIQRFYSYDNCIINKIEREMEINFEFSGASINASYVLKLTFDSDLIEVTDAADFTKTFGPDGNGIVEYETGEFTTSSNNAEIQEIYAKTDQSGTAPSIEYEVYNFNVPAEIIESGTLTFPAFEDIDGSTPVKISDNPSELVSYPQSLTTDQFITLNGTLVIDEDYGFGSGSNGGSQIVMEANSEIVVEGGKTLELY